MGKATLQEIYITGDTKCVEFRQEFNEFSKSPHLSKYGFFDEIEVKDLEAAVGANYKWVQWAVENEFIDNPLTEKEALKALAKDASICPYCFDDSELEVDDWYSKNGRLVFDVYCHNCQNMIIVESLKY